VGESDGASGAKSRAVQLAVEALDPGQTFAITDLERACPTVSRATIRRVLGQLREQGLVECLAQAGQRVGKRAKGDHVHVKRDHLMPDERVWELDLVAGASILAEKMLQHGTAANSAAVLLGLALTAQWWPAVPFKGDNGCRRPGNP
jgi:hypothetical protein